MPRRPTSVRSLFSQLRATRRLVQRQSRLAARLMQATLREAARQVTRAGSKAPGGSATKRAAGAPPARAPGSLPRTPLARPGAWPPAPTPAGSVSRPAQGAAGNVPAAVARPRTTDALRALLTLPTPPWRHGPPPAPGFQSDVFTRGAVSRRYKVYVPARSGRRPPLLLMLHGCTQHPDDFATGTRANRLADEVGCIVVYPEQARSANPNRCWNWFRPEHQRVDGEGEAALLADLVETLVARHDADPHRVYAAGLSAGGAMVALLARERPRLFAAIAVHAGLPAHAAHDVSSAMQAMRHGTGLTGGAAGAAAVPTLVFHGDRDRTVHVRNGEALAQACVAAFARAAGGPHLKLRARVEQGHAGTGRAWTRTTWVPWRGAPVVEQWIVHGGPHAWSGGAVGGSHTDPDGPDATAAMWRFFVRHASRPG